MLSKAEVAGEDGVALREGDAPPLPDDDVGFDERAPRPKRPTLAYGVIAALCAVGLVGVALGLRPHHGSDIVTVQGVATGEPPVSALGREDALVIEDLEVGPGGISRPGDVVKVRYWGTLVDGTPFDSTEKHGDQPFSFVLGKGDVIAGWEQGIVGMRALGRRKLRIPPHLGYGDRGVGETIPPKSTLVFEVQLLDVERDGKSLGPDPETRSDPLRGEYSIADATRDLPGNGRIVAEISTPQGDLSCTLFDSQAPNTVANFIGLATGKRAWREPKIHQWVNRPAYDDTSFHRIIKDFMIQGGDVKGDGSGEPGYVVKDEIWEGGKHDRAGLLCSANRGPNTNGAQFFITDAAAAHIDGSYTIFGECSTVDTVHAIARQPTKGDRPTDRIPITRVAISRVR